MPVNNIVVVSSTVQINGTDMPFMDWQVRAGSYGSAGSCSLKLDMLAMQNKGINLMQMSQAQSVPTIDIRVTSGASQDLHIFSGGLDKTHWCPKQNYVEVEGRDASAALIDDKRVMSSLNLENQTIDQVVRQIATKYKLTPRITTPQSNAQIGLIFKQDATFTPHPRPVWDLLQFLARNSGSECFVTPENELFFGPANSQNQSITCVWMPSSTNTNQNNYPLLDLEIDHQPRRNRTFTVIVNSYHRKTVQMNKSVSVSNGQNTPVSSVGVSGAVIGNSTGSVGALTTTKTIPAGLYTGSAGKSASNQLSSALQGHPTYTYHFQDLSPDQCQQKAQAIAQDIAKREIVVTGKVDGNPLIKPQTPLIIQDSSPGGQLNALDFQQLTISSVTHRYDMPQMGRSTSGYITEFSALQIPPAATTGGV